MIFMRPAPTLSDPIKPVCHSFGLRLVSLISEIATNSPAIIREGPVWPNVGPIFYVDFEQRLGELRKTIAALRVNMQ
jgi:hypothetical protein